VTQIDPCGECGVARSGCLRSAESATLPLRHATPDPEALIVGECVLKALRANLTGHAHALRLAGGSTLLGKEGLRIGLGAQRLGASLEILGLDQQQVGIGIAHRVTSACEGVGTLGGRAKSIAGAGG